MNISGRCDYACRAMMELALRQNTGLPVSAQLIAEQRGIPEKYLTHILLQLKRARLVKSIRGAQGGYALLEAPETITLHRIIEAIDGPIMAPSKSQDASGGELREFWRRMANEVGSLLEGVSLQAMLDLTQKTTMFHI